MRQRDAQIFDLSCVELLDINSDRADKVRVADDNDIARAVSVTAVARPARPDVRVACYARAIAAAFARTGRVAELDNPGERRGCATAARGCVR
jgi:hypothetical protein